MIINNFRRVLLLLFVKGFCLSNQSPIIRFPVQVVNQKGEPELVENTGDHASCVPLEECKTFTWMLEYENIQNEVVQIEPIEVAKLIRSKRCALHEIGSDTLVTMDTRVTCPHTAEEGDDYDDYYNEINIRDDDIYDYEEDCNMAIRSEMGGGLETKRATADIDCTLEFTHGPFEDILSSLETTHFSGERKKYRRLRKLDTRKVLHVEAHGHCCWEIFKEPYFKGDIHHVEPGNSVYPVHQPRSVQRVCC